MGQIEVIYFIRECILDKGTEHERTRYDWTFEGGLTESDEYFETVEKAREDVESYFG